MSDLDLISQPGLDQRVRLPYPTILSSDKWVGPEKTEYNQLRVGINVHRQSIGHVEIVRKTPTIFRVTHLKQVELVLHLYTYRDNISRDTVLAFIAS